MNSTLEATEELSSALPQTSESRNHHSPSLSHLSHKAGENTSPLCHAARLDAVAGHLFGIPAVVLSHFTFLSRYGADQVRCPHEMPMQTTSPAPHTASSHSSETWPALPQDQWSDTCATLQLWLQIVGKVRLALVPPINHTWNVTLYPTIRGLTTLPMAHGERMLQIDFDFIHHQLHIDTGDGASRTLQLQSMPVADFYQKVMAALHDLAAPVRIWPMPVEIENAIPLDQDQIHRSYDPEFAQRFWRVLLQTTRVFTQFRARFRGKASPIHLFWGALDLACTRFSGRAAPEHPSMANLADRVTRDAYSHEVSSAGFWPGAPGIEPFFYSYAYPEPPGYSDYRIKPTSASYDKNFGEFILPYESMRQSPAPDIALLEFLQSTYEAAATCGQWDRSTLELE